MDSYARGEDLPLCEKTISQVLDDAAARDPDHQALVSRHQDLRLNYGELREKARQTAAGLWALGLRPGDRVGMWASSCAEWVYLQAASAQIGAVLVNVNPAYRAADLRYILEKSGIKALILRERDERVDYREILERARHGQALALEHVILLDHPTWDELIDQDGQPPDHPVGIHDVVNIQYTSGTTGSPKGVLLSHHNLVNNAYLIGRGLRWTPDDRLCSPVPMYHCFGCVLGSLQSIVHSVTLVMPAATFDPRAALEAIDQERCTTVYGVPTMFVAMLNHPEFGRFDMNSLRTGIMAGAPCPIELMKRVVDEMHCPEMSIAYGQTESSPVITQCAVDDPLEIRVGTVGSACPMTEVKIIDPGSGRTVPIGVQGELCTRGYLVMKGYDGDPAATAAAVDSDGWLHTGDLAAMREDDNFRITGRIKEMIIRGGENISPREIEEFLHRHPKIADVYVTGLPDERLGERVLAWIRLHDGQTAGEDDIKDFCRGEIAHFKIPEYIRFVDEFPMTVTGKVQKFEMRRQEIELRGLQAAAQVETA
jgi:fatty-acyl-CoA synthase